MSPAPLPLSPRSAIIVLMSDEHRRLTAWAGLADPGAFQWGPKRTGGW